jgi:UMF1 family MFS transporter
MARSLLARRDVFSWCLYDWANSAFTTSVITVVLPVYFLTLTPRAEGPVTVRLGPLSYQTYGDALWTYITGFYELAAAAAGPILGAMADCARGKKRYLGLCVAIGAALTCAIAAVPAGGFELCAVLYIGAAFAWASGNLFYDALLPDLASDSREMDAISSAGYAIGYLGGGLLLALNLVMVSRPAWFGFADAASGTRGVFVTVGLWWALFAIPLFLHVRERIGGAQPRRTGSVLTVGFRRLSSTLGHVRRYRQAARLLFAFILYNTGIGTVITVAAVYGKAELRIRDASLIGCVLMIQFLGFPARFGFIALARRLGAKRAVLAGLGVYVVAVVYAYFMHATWEFWLLGVLVALVQGGTQALSRSLFGSMIPEGHSAEFFGFFSVFSKVGTFAGPLCFGLVKDLTGSSRSAIVFLAAFFVLGALVLLTVNVAEGKTAAIESRNADP